jgi:hypothetical protein
MMKRLAVAFALMGALSAPPAFAETAASPSAREVVDATGQDRAVYMGFIGGVYEGLLIGNSFNNMSKQPRIFCIPEDKQLTDGDIWTIFSSFVKDNPDMLDKPASISLYFALRRTYPCGS